AIDSCNQTLTHPPPTDEYKLCDLTFELIHGDADVPGKTDEIALGPRIKISQEEDQYQALKRKPPVNRWEIPQSRAQSNVGVRGIKNEQNQPEIFPWCEVVELHPRATDNSPPWPPQGYVKFCMTNKTLISRIHCIDSAAVDFFQHGKEEEDAKRTNVFSIKALQHYCYAFASFFCGVLSSAQWNVQFSVPLSSASLPQDKKKKIKMKWKREVSLPEQTSKKRLGDMTKDNQAAKSQENTTHWSAGSSDCSFGFSAVLATALTVVPASHTDWPSSVYLQLASVVPIDSLHPMQ
ncbi:hypothetical protein U0070_022978, partial [Myodes glareolus]